MMWIALALPDLALQVSHRGLMPDLPLAISNGAVQRPLVIAANRPAQTVGVRPGMAVTAAQAIAENLVVQPRDPQRELAALHALATWATQFTPTVVLDTDGVLLEVQASLRLFGGLAALGSRLEQGAKQLGFTVSLSGAPTPLAALLFARARILDPAVRGCITTPRLPDKLAPLPLALFDWPADTLDTLARLGIDTIGACRALPRDGLLRRFGPQPLHDLDRADDSMPDPRTAFVPPARFFSRIELAAELDNLAWLTLPVRQLLIELEGYLRARQQGTQQLRLTFGQGRQLQFTVQISTGAPCCFADEFAALVQEQMARIVLNAPVQSVALEVERTMSYLPQNATLVADGASQTLAWTQLCDRLLARLPADHLHRIAAADDHRPEKAWRRESSLHAAPRKTSACKSLAARAALADVKASCLEGPMRPAWLLPSPRPLALVASQPAFDGPLTMLTEPERIEAGWWDEYPVSRDYYIASNPVGQLCWVFHDHATKSWYLHGFFG